MNSRIAFLLVSLFVLLPQITQAQEYIASWNIQNLGWNNNKDYAALGVIGAHFDFIAVQEVMNEEGITRLRHALEAETGSSWLDTCSHLVGRGNYREMYCFIWKEDSFTLEGGETVFFDNRDVFAREPYSAIFESATGFRFVATSIHAIYGKNVAGRQAEAQALRAYYDWLTESFPDIPVFLIGDFNLAPTNPAWAPLGEVMHPLIQDGATTISTIDGRFANLYDNIWVPVDHALPILEYGRLEFPHQVLGITHEEARATVSDHIPVWVKVDGQADGVVFSPHQVAGQIRPASQSDGDESSTSEASILPIIGNRNSSIFHLPGCPSYHLVAAHNQVLFDTKDETRSAGFRRAGDC